MGYADIVSSFIAFKNSFWRVQRLFLSLVLRCVETVDHVPHGGVGFRYVHSTQYLSFRASLKNNESQWHGFDGTEVINGGPFTSDEQCTCQGRGVKA